MILVLAWGGRETNIVSEKRISVFFQVPLWTDDLIIAFSLSCSEKLSCDVYVQ